MKYVVLFAAVALAGQEFESVGQGYANVARDGQGNYYVVESTETAGLAVSVDAAQKQYGGGVCVVGSKPFSTGPCPDLFLRKIAPDAKTVLAATYLGGNGLEAARELLVDQEGRVIVSMLSYSSIFGGGFLASEGNSLVVVRLNSGLSEIEAVRRFEFNGSIQTTIAAEGKLYVGGTRYLGVEGGSAYVTELGERLESRKVFEYRLGLGGAFFGLGRQSNGNLVASWGGSGKAAQVVGIDGASGEVRWQREIEAPSTVTALGILKGDGVVVFGNTLSNHPAEGFVQRFGAGGEVVEAAQRIGQAVQYGRVVGGTVIEWIGVGRRGLETSPRAPVRCRPFEGAAYLGRMRYDEGSPSFVSYLYRYMGGFAGWFEAFPVLRSGSRFSMLELPAEGEVELAACLEPEAESYASALGKASIENYQDLAGQTVAPGEFLTLYGAGISTGRLVVKPEETGGVPVEVAGTRVLVDGVAAGIVAISPTSVTIVAPYGIAGRESVAVELERDGVRVGATTLKVLTSKPYLLSEWISGEGYAGVYLNGQLSTPERMVSAGDEVSVYLTGAGVLDAPVDANAVVEAKELPRPAQEVKAFVEGSGGQVVLFAGAVRGQLPGLTQVNVRIAPDLKYFGRLTLTIIVDGRRASTSFWKTR